MVSCGHCGEQHPDGTETCPRTEFSLSAKGSIGSVLAGKYKLLHLLGVGGMGSVYAAENIDIGRRVAVKVLNPNFAKSGEAVERLRREARAASAVGHPNIIDVLDLGRTDDGSPFIVMEVLSGESLAERIQRDGPQDPTLAAFIAAQVLSALGAAHQKGIIHRDLKPENVFLVDEGDQLRIKVLDFGISKIDEPSAASMRLTRTGFVMGTPYYMSPEQARGAGTLDARCDLYSCGVLLYEAVTGRPPFTADNYNALLATILADAPVPPRRLQPAVPIALEQVILHAMAKNREERFPNAGAMLDAIRPLLAPGARVLGTGAMRAAAGTGPRQTGMAVGGAGTHGTPGRTSMSWVVSEQKAGAGKLRIGIAVAALLLIGGGVAGWVATHGSHSVADAPRVGSVNGRPTVTPAAPPPAPAPTPPAPVRPPEPVPAAEDAVRIHVEARPANARLLLDGAELPANPFDGRFPRSSTTHILRAEADRFQPVQQVLSFDRSRDVQLKLVPIRQRTRTDLEENPY